MLLVRFSTESPTAVVKKSLRCGTHNVGILAYNRLTRTHWCYEAFSVLSDFPLYRDLNKPMFTSSKEFVGYRNHERTCLIKKSNLITFASKEEMEFTIRELIFARVSSEIVLGYKFVRNIFEVQGSIKESTRFIESKIKKEGLVRGCRNTLGTCCVVMEHMLKNYVIATRNCSSVTSNTVLCKRRATVEELGGKSSLHILYILGSVAGVIVVFTCLIILLKPNKRDKSKQKRRNQKNQNQYYDKIYDRKQQIYDSVSRQDQSDDQYQKRPPPPSRAPPQRPQTIVAENAYDGYEEIVKEAEKRKQNQQDAKKSLKKSSEKAEYEVFLDKVKAKEEKKPKRKKEKHNKKKHKEKSKPTEEVIYSEVSSSELEAKLLSLPASEPAPPSPVNKQAAYEQYLVKVREKLDKKEMKKKAKREAKERRKRLLAAANGAISESDIDSSATVADPSAQSLTEDVSQTGSDDSALKPESYEVPPTFEIQPSSNAPELNSNTIIDLQTSTPNAENNLNNNK
uniref:Recep_L_domain domain-containing protein n=1 Tax=Syphacia muris TaxID=451379 RepID=A0A0N5AU11_9BILA